MFSPFSPLALNAASLILRTVRGTHKLKLFGSFHLSWNTQAQTSLFFRVLVFAVGASFLNQVFFFMLGIWRLRFFVQSSSGFEISVRSLRESKHWCDTILRCVAILKRSHSEPSIATSLADNRAALPRVKSLRGHMFWRSFRVSGQSQIDARDPDSQSERRKEHRYGVSKHNISASTTHDSMYLAILTDLQRKGVLRPFRLGSSNMTLGA